MAEPTSRQRGHLDLVRAKLAESRVAEEGLLTTIVRARRDPGGLTWEQIGEALGTTRQGAQQRYGAACSGDGDQPGELRDEIATPERPQNWWLIHAGASALTAAGQTPFTRIGVYEWVWERYPAREHGRPSLDPTFQGMVRNATGGPPSACGTPLIRVGRGLYVLADSEGGDGRSQRAREA